MKKNIMKLRQNISGYVMTLPAIILIIIFVIIPSFLGLYYSFQKWDGFNEPIFIGLKNYFSVITNDKIFHIAFKNTIIYAVAVVIAKNVLGLLLALLVNKKLRGMGIFRVSFFIPVTLSYVAVGLMWSWIYNPNIGLINSGLDFIGLGNLSVAWLGNQNTVLWAIIFVEIWKWIGFHMVIYLAGLQTIPQELYEVAELDGAKSWQRLFSITIPMLTPIIFINVLLAVNGAFVNNFDLVHVMTQGGPGHASEVMLTHLISTAFENNELGAASAMGFILFVVSGTITAIYAKISNRSSET